MSEITRPCRWPALEPRGWPELEHELAKYLAENQRSEPPERVPVGVAELA